MEITIIGWLVIALTIYGFFKSEDFLLYLGIFFFYIYSYIYNQYR